MDYMFQNNEHVVGLGEEGKERDNCCPEEVKQTFD